MTFLTDEDAEARELFLTAHEISQPLENLLASAGSAFIEIRDSRMPLNKSQRDFHDFKKVISAQYDSQWKLEKLGDKVV